MATKAFLFTDTVALAASGTGTAKLSVSAGETAKIHALGFVSTGAFSLVGLKDGTGRAFSDANADNPIPSTALHNFNSAINGPPDFPEPIELLGPLDLNIELLDTSAAGNTVRFVGIGTKETA
jgi:hypothetical protein